MQKSKRYFPTAAPTIKPALQLTQPKDVAHNPRTITCDATPRVKLRMTATNEIREFILKDDHYVYAPFASGIDVAIPAYTIHNAQEFGITVFLSQYGYELA